MYAFTRTQDIAAPPEQVFAWFTDVRHLGRIAPTFLRLTWVTDPDVAVEAETRIDYKVALYGVPFRWRTRILSMEPPLAFAYEQEIGPCRSWRHAYRFEPTPYGTRVIDEVEYDVGWGWLGRIAHDGFLHRTVKGLFDHRALVIAHELGTPPRSTP